MPRPERIEYENAVYHVMNRGRGRQMIFHGDDYYHAFAGALSEAHRRFGVLIHAYCLMGNHYHLLLQTPRANLSRIMRHINGVYTQRYNRLKDSDGTLFRGRYKALLVEDDAHALYVSRYIHRNPIEMKKPKVERLEQYPYSSYPAYINKTKAPDWLETKFLFGLEGSLRRYAGMKRFVGQDIDETTESLYQKARWPMVYGGESFRNWIYDVKLPEKSAPEKAALVTNTPSLEHVLSSVGHYYKKTRQELVTLRRGKGTQNMPRNVAIYLCQEIAEKKLREIAPVFGLSHANSASYVTSRVRKRLKEDRALGRDIEGISRIIIETVT